MKWVLLFYIRGCVGLECEIPAYEYREFSTEAECNTALEFWMKSSPKAKTVRHNGRLVTDHTGQHVGICYQTDDFPMDQSEAVWGKEVR